MLACRNLRHEYGKGALRSVVLDGIDVELRGRESCLLLGPSGSGKTTLLSILGCLLSPTDGEVHICGERVCFAQRPRLTALRREAIGFVFQHSQLLPFLSLRENLAIVGRNAGLPSNELNRRIDQRLERLAIAEFESRRPHEVSGGQRQRFAIARALLHAPKIVLADEPTAALDWRHGFAAVNLLIDEVRASGAVLLVVTHDTRLTPLFDRKLHIEHGRIVEQL